MAKRRVTIEQWLIDALSDPDKGGAASTVSLVYVKPGGSHQEIHSKSLKGATHNAKSLADFFMNKATGYAQDLPGIQTFKILAFYGTDQPQAEFPFTVADGEMTAGGEIAFARHEPTTQGLLAQLMKHNEQTTSMLMQIAQTVTVQAVLREQQLRAEVAEAQGIVRDVIMDMTKTNQAHEMAKLTFARESEERRMLGKMLPSAVNYVAGREVMPQELADSSMLDAMAEKVKPEHLSMLVQMKILTQEQATLLAARFTRTLEQRAKERELLKTAPTEEKPPEHAPGTNGVAAGNAEAE
jgi:hypothetical protein